MNQVFVSWSGGKDSCLACYRALVRGLKVRYLANMVTKDGQKSRSHGLSADILRVQSQAIGIPIVQRKTTWSGYETVFKRMLRALKDKGITGGIFGDIDLDEHREWVERVCREVEITPHLPLWGDSQYKILRDFINLGFEAIVVTTKAEVLGAQWLGRNIDRDFIDQLSEQKNNKDITLCGEAGEYHTLVIDGPIFQKRMEILETRKVLSGEHWTLEILRALLRAK